ncbi:hemolysin III family protein [uncultured Sulfitobacter sp.]|uniref:PAQR family membrane homeostasis protein TrhA n=1 Tax=uncultured Sulfitobacter sp. TaxID=191468 RepID=UPI0026390F7D|nr:hemolysin III family protein [uncultured Sulfitobacter sp.]
MTPETYPSVNPIHRRADMAVHVTGLLLIIVAGSIVITRAAAQLSTPLFWAVSIYVVCALVSNLASWAYHFAPWHGQRTLLRRIDHAAIYPSITGTFTPFFVFAGTGWTTTLLWVCWALTAVAIWNKITNAVIKSKWSTASYLGLGALGLSAVPDLGDVPWATLWCILAGALCYVVGTAFYARKTMPFRYAIWHCWVNFGGIAMFAGIWLALF